MKYTLITGASSGIGKALSFQYAEKGHNLIVTARREYELNKLKAEIQDKYDVEVVIKPFDLSEPDAAERLYEELAGLSLENMINNAGFGDFSMPWDVDVTKAQRMIDLNVRTLTTLSLLFVRDYANHNSTLINVASVGGYSIFDIAVTYCATKFYVSSFTEGLAQSLKEQGLPMQAKVLAPGPTESEFVTQSSHGGAIAGDNLFAEDSFISAPQLASYAYQLYESDADVGIVNNRKLELKKPMYPYISVPH